MLRRCGFSDHRIVCTTGSFRGIAKLYPFPFNQYGGTTSSRWQCSCMQTALHHSPPHVRCSMLELRSSLYDSHFLPTAVQTAVTKPKAEQSEPIPIKASTIATPLQKRAPSSSMASTPVNEACACACAILAQAPADFGSGDLWHAGRLDAVGDAGKDGDGARNHVLSARRSAAPGSTIHCTTGG